MAESVYKIWSRLFRTQSSEGIETDMWCNVGTESLNRAILLTSCVEASLNDGLVTETKIDPWHLC